MFSLLFGFPDPANLTFDYTDANFVAPNAVLFRESFNPDFGNSEFDPLVEDTALGQRSPDIVAFLMQCAARSMSSA